MRGPRALCCMTVSATLLNDLDQFAAAYGFAPSPARLALEGHDWKAATLFEVKPAWFPWNRFRNAEWLVHYRKASAEPVGET